MPSSSKVVTVTAAGDEQPAHDEAAAEDGSAALAGPEPAIEKHIWTYPRLVVQNTCAMCGLNLVLIMIAVAIPISAGHASLTKETNFDWIISSEDASICAV